MNPAKTYRFNEQLAIEAHWKGRYLALLDRQGIAVEEIDHLAVQRLGIDAIVRIGDWRHSIEFKTDFQAQHTGNFFVETISNDVDDTPGWAYTSTAQLLGLYLIGQGRLLLIPMWDLKQRLNAWKDIYPTRSCQNPTYRSHGVLVPLTKLEAISARILEEDSEDQKEEAELPSFHEEQDQKDSPRRQDGRKAQRSRNRRVRTQRQVHTQAQV